MYSQNFVPIHINVTLIVVAHKRILRIGLSCPIFIFFRLRKPFRCEWNWLGNEIQVSKKLRNYDCYKDLFMYKFQFDIS